MLLQQVISEKRAGDWWFNYNNKEGHILYIPSSFVAIMYDYNNEKQAYEVSIEHENIMIALDNTRIGGVRMSDLIRTLEVNPILCAWEWTTLQNRCIVQHYRAALLEYLKDHDV